MGYVSIFLQPGPCRVLNPPDPRLSSMRVPMRSRSAGNVGYDADELAVLAQTPQRIQRNVKSLGIQSAETFVQKQGIHPDIPAGKSGKSEGEGEAYQKTFAAGKIFGCAYFSGLPVIPYRQLQTCAFAVREGARSSV